MGSRCDEPWYAEAIRSEDWTPFFYGRWNDDARVHAGREDEQRSAAATDGFGLGSVDPAELMAGMAQVDVPVLIVGGSLDPLGPAVSTHWAGLLPRAEVVIVDGVGHYPWVDDPAAVRGVLEAFLLLG